MQPPAQNPTHRESPASEPVEPRRGFFARAAAVVIGSIVSIFPLVAGLAMFVDPLRRKAGAVQEIRVASLDSVPDDGVPRQFPIIAEHRDDAWTRFSNEPIGTVYLIRHNGKKEVQAFNSTCPHAGCFVAYVARTKSFACPCHRSGFDVNGKRTNQVAPRGMDSLECRVVGNDILVKFQNFQVARPDKKPKA